MFDNFSEVKEFVNLLQKWTLFSYLLHIVSLHNIASPGQKSGACGHLIAAFDKHTHCAHCCGKGSGSDP